MNIAQAIDGLVEACRRDVPDCLGVGVVDLSTGMMLRIDVRAGLSSDLVELLGAATVELLQGRAVRRIERLVRERRAAAEERHYFHEILVHSEDHVHLFLRSRRRPDIAVGVLCAPTVTVGLLFSEARRALRAFDAGSPEVMAGGQA